MLIHPVGFFSGRSLIDQWTLAANMPWAYAGIGAVPLADGRVLVCGGYDGGGAKNTAAIYTPGTNSWASVANMPWARRYHAAAPLADGRVLVCGGDSSTAIYG